MKVCTVRKISHQNSNICYKFCCSLGLHGSVAVLEAGTTIIGFNKDPFLCSKSYCFHNINHLDYEFQCESECWLGNWKK